LISIENIARHARVIVYEFQAPLDFTSTRFFGYNVPQKNKFRICVTLIRECDIKPNFIKVYMILISSLFVRTSMELFSKTAKCNAVCNK